MPYINCERIFSHQHCTSRPGLFKLGWPDAPSCPHWVCRSHQTFLTPSFLPPPLIPTVSFSGFYWVSELGVSVEVGLCILQRKGWVCPQAAPPLGQAGWLGLPLHSLHTALYSEPLATLTTPVPVQLHGALGPQEVSTSPSPHSKPMSPSGLGTGDVHLQV